MRGESHRGAVPGDALRDRLQQQAGQPEKDEPEYPILFISGAEDPVGDCGKGVRGAPLLPFRRAGARDVTVKLYPTLRHELLQEAEAPRVCEDLYQWLNDRMPEV